MKFKYLHYARFTLIIQDNPNCVMNMMNMANSTKRSMRVIKVILCRNKRRVIPGEISNKIEVLFNARLTSYGN